jgi:O-antigen ligase
MGYVMISTLDVRIGPIPLKWLLTVGAVVAWWMACPISRRLDRGLVLSVVVIALAIPTMWLGVAAVRSATGDPTQAHGLRDAAEQASRFTYILLALPLRDWISRSLPRQRHYLWLIPALLLCAVTWSLFVGYLLGADYGYSGQVGPFRGTIGSSSPGGFRAFLVNDVVFIPAAILTLSSVRLRGLDWLSGLVLFSVLSAAFLAHARGIWVGLSVSAVVLIALSSPLIRTRGIIILGIALVFGFVINAAPYAARPIVDAITGGTSEISTSSRLQQGPKLLNGFEAHPILGSGLGGWLSSGYRRSQDAPWSFELAYLQLLFQLGVVGLACFAAALLPVLRTGWRHLRGSGTETRILALAGVSSLFGYLFTCGGNPYIMTSVGTFVLGISFALCSAQTDAVVETSHGAVMMDARRQRSLFQSSSAARTHY